ncbi:hypothetical protein CW309_16910 [Pseudomonas hunanensis]|uniref:Uncharacterized protein n=1 Tax=Pseudomonas hunanensis TaxID=1247546 RepID=A0ACC9MZX6_9PSED|nr:hypothetical protein CW309_16910 [Pseudomonas hunanensis]
MCRDIVLVGTGLPAKKAARWMAPALPVFAGKPAPTGDLASRQRAGQWNMNKVSLENCASN